MTNAIKFEHEIEITKHVILDGEKHNAKLTGKDVRAGMQILCITTEHCNSEASDYFHAGVIYNIMPRQKQHGTKIHILDADQETDNLYIVSLDDLVSDSKHPTFISWTKLSEETKLMLKLRHNMSYAEEYYK